MSLLKLDWLLGTSDTHGQRAEDGARTQTLSVSGEDCRATAGPDTGKYAWKAYGCVKGPPIHATGCSTLSSGRIQISVLGPWRSASAASRWPSVRASRAHYSPCSRCTRARPSRPPGSWKACGGSATGECPQDGPALRPQLRKALANGDDGGEILTRGRGYELRLGDGGLDAQRFEQLITRGHPREALVLWRGAPLADVADEPFAGGEIRRLEELRLRAIELAVDSDLAGGRHREVVGEIEAAAAEEPLRERLHAQRMLALYRSGRQADALEAYRDFRGTLVEAIGAEPGPDLRHLHEAILRQDPELEPPGDDTAELPPELDVGTALVGRERGARRAARALAACARRRRTARRRHGRARYRQDPPRRPSWQRSCTATARPCSTPPAPAHRSRHAPRSRARAPRGGRRSW